MKKLSEKQRVQQFRKIRKRFIRRLKGKERKRPKPGPMFARMWYRDAIWNAKVNRGNNPQTFPQIMCFRRNPSKTLGAFSEVRRNLHKNLTHQIWFPEKLNPQKIVKVKSFISMSSVKDMSTSAALVLAAEYERKTKYMREAPPIFDLHKWDGELTSKLFQIGFFERFGYEVSSDWEKSNSDDILTVPFYSGSKSEMRLVDQKLIRLVEHIDPGTKIPNKMRLALNSAVGEAANNTREHAYVDHDFKYPHVGLWWATGAASQSKRLIVISLYDQGVTIPVSYPKLPVFSSLKEKLNLFEKDIFEPYKNDAKLIQAAAIYGKSGRVSKSGGYGIPQMKDAIDLCGEGSLMILSRGGRYLYSIVDGKPHEELDVFNQSVGGTLIEWQIRLPE